MTEVTEAKGSNKDYEIVVNGTPVVVEDQMVTYEQVVGLAYPTGPPNATYSVAYRNAHGGHGGSGTLVPGGSVKVKKKGTSFNVTLTTRS